MSLGCTFVQVPKRILNSLHNLHHTSCIEIYRLHKTGTRHNITEMLFLPIAKFYLRFSKLQQYIVNNYFVK